MFGSKRVRVKTYMHGTHQVTDQIRRRSEADQAKMRRAKAGLTSADLPVWLDGFGECHSSVSIWLVREGRPRGFYLFEGCVRGHIG
jgi:hypothetical protein